MPPIPTTSIKKYWLTILLITAFVFFSLLSIYALRDNNKTMMRLRDVVYTTDKQNGDVESALKNLRVYVYGHMNTNLHAGMASNEPPIQLVSRFNRVMVAEQARVANIGDANKIYVEAQNQCEKASLPLSVRAQCIQDYVTNNGSGIPQINIPPKEFYTFDFASPAWSPDLAGLSIVITCIIGLIIISRFISSLIIKRIN